MTTHSDSSPDLRSGQARRSPRVNPGPLRVRLHRACEGILVNISATGALLQVPWALSPERRVTVDLQIGDTPLQLHGRVVRSSPHRLQMADATLARTEYYVAVEFSDLPGEQVAALQRLLVAEQLADAVRSGDVPELPDVLLYLHALRSRILGQRVAAVRLANPFLLRSIDPPLASVEGRTVVDLHRIGKRIVIELEGEIFLVIHLMIAGRFRWKAPGTRIPGKVGLLALDFEHGSLILTEAGTKRQASLHVVSGRSALAQHDRGGLEVLDADIQAYIAVLLRENHTLKRALTDPHLFSGIGNAYSDEILHAARLSPFKQTASLSDDEIRRLYEATRVTLTRWITRLKDDAGDCFPEKVTAFHEGMAVHGRYGKPCPDCGSPVQRVVYAANEANYCANCQTGGRLLADRSLSRLLREDWPRTLDELERRKKSG